MNKYFISAMLACTLTHITGPKGMKPGWRIKCGETNGRQEYLPKYPKHLGAAKNEAFKYLRSHLPKQSTVSVQALKNER